MKITKAQLKQIIKEELEAVLDEEIVEEDELEEGIEDFDLKLGGGAGGAIERKKGTYNPYTVGDAVSDIKGATGRLATTVTTGAQDAAKLAGKAVRKAGELSVPTKRERENQGYYGLDRY